jgi:hypothetical protein
MKHLSFCSALPRLKWMRLFRAPVISVLTLITLGCTKGAPTFATLDSGAIPQPKFAGLTEETINASSSTETFAIFGDCDSSITSITGDVVNGASTFSTLTSMSASPITVDCANSGHFSFTLKGLSSLGISPQNNQTYDVQLRGITSGGVSNPSTIHIAYSTNGGPDSKHILITSGSTLGGGGTRFTSGTVVKAQIRVTNKLKNYTLLNADAMTTTYGAMTKMKSGLAAKDDQ